STLLPVNGLDPSFAADVGGSAIMRSDDLSRTLGTETWMMLEGANPSGSFKDRGLAMAVALAGVLGASRLCLPTQGNAGVAAALFSSRLGLESCLVYMPLGHRGSRYHKAAEHYGAQDKFSGANIAAAGKQMRSDVAQQLANGQYVHVSTFFEPGRLEGKKTMGLEIATHFGASDLPEVMVYPTGGGTGLVGIWKAMTELVKLGVLHNDTKLPKLVAVQSSNCAPVVESFRSGLAEVEPVVSAGTCADGLDVPGAIMGHAMLAAIRESGGTAVSVSEDEIRQDFTWFGTRGIAAGYESAATLAAARRLRASGDISPNDKVLLLVTSGSNAALG
ncbi:MAG: pyridoxal-phosphate dependent enzyme, partial [Acidimicrobiales bacterium]